MTRIAFIFARTRPLAYISHLDLLRLFLRAFRRSRLPLAYSQGFNPHPRFSLALPLPLAVTADKEAGEIYLTERISVKDFISSLKPQLPQALPLKGVLEISADLPALAAQVTAASYSAELRFLESDNIQEFREKVDEALVSLVGKKEIFVKRFDKKKRVKTVDIRPQIIEAGLGNSSNESLKLHLLLQAGSQGGLSPQLFLEKLADESAAGLVLGSRWLLHRQDLLVEKEGKLQSLSEGMCI